MVMACISFICKKSHVNFYLACRKFLPGGKFPSPAAMARAGREEFKGFTRNMKPSLLPGAKIDEGDLPMTGLYFRPATLKEALDILKDKGSVLKPIAGCTDVSVAREEKVLDRRSYIDLSYMKFLSFIREEGGMVLIGATATHGEIAASPLVQKRGQVLAQACHTVGSPLIRNRATVGGNVCHGSPAGDSIPALMALDAHFHLQSAGGDRWVSAVQFFRGPGKTVREDGELLTEIRFPATGDGYFHLYQKMGQRKALACSKASMAFVAKVQAGKISDVRIACGAVAPTVVRAVKTEAFLEGKKLTPGVVAKAAEMVQGEVCPIDDLRSTREYRVKIMGVLLEKALKAACP
jgi:CO/xanthine dehydrogenase FAD-binding subunit